jgi:hypothetical protein
MAPSNQNMDQKNFVSPLGPWEGWEGLGTETPSLAPIIMPSASGLLRIFLKKTLHLMLPYPSIDKLWRIGGCHCTLMVQKFTSMSPHPDHFKPETPE